VPPSVPSLVSLPSSTFRSFGWKDEGGQQHLLLEVLPHSFIEYVKDMPLYYYTLDANTSSHQELVLTCSRTSKECYNVHGPHCSMSIHISLLPTDSSIEGVEG
jgi:hypothetical protein